MVKATGKTEGSGEGNQAGVDMMRMSSVYTWLLCLVVLDQRSPPALPQQSYLSWGVLGAVPSPTIKPIQK
jgi:hypothetical protein